MKNSYTIFGLGFVGTNIVKFLRKKKYKVFLQKRGIYKFDKNLHNLRGKWGIFFEYNISSLNKIKSYINNKYQTLTYCGLKKENLEAFVKKNSLKGIDRIVPIGQALDIDFFWDGYDLNRILTRVIDLKWKNFP